MIARNVDVSYLPRVQKGFGDNISRSSESIGFCFAFRMESRRMMGGVVPIKIDNMMDSCLIMTSSTEEVRLHYKGYNDICIVRASGI